ncbi:hypothetical protein ANANG_G00155940, partial [Anguilla anguilla]
MESYTLHCICPVLCTTQLIQMPSQVVCAVTMFWPMKAVTLHIGRAHTTIAPIQPMIARAVPSICSPAETIFLDFCCFSFVSKKGYYEQFSRSDVFWLRMVPQNVFQTPWTPVLIYSCERWGLSSVCRHSLPNWFFALCLSHGRAVPKGFSESLLLFKLAIHLTKNLMPIYGHFPLQVDTFPHSFALLRH